jgi:hypothetical protein
LPDPPEMLVWLIVHPRFVEFVVRAKATVPVNPLMDATVIVELPIEPVFSATVAGLAIRVKSRAAVTL